MADIPARELRNDTAGLLRRVEGGEEITITVHGRPVARLVSVDPWRRPIPGPEFAARLQTHQADPALRDELRDLVGETSDEDGLG
ncbi:type II toxin-antitoxin system prevent-host-death family antitoxin [Microbacterium sp. X-17]|uniref:type II toxin-antitoxin system Phd/YefM family antitoxin n=1 Tax=Microbacterium sp. X-17 TaxID=3144404 RepID=UPI0031F5702E